MQLTHKNIPKQDKTYQDVSEYIIGTNEGLIWNDGIPDPRDSDDVRWAIIRRVFSRR